MPVIVRNPEALVIYENADSFSKTDEGEVAIWDGDLQVGLHAPIYDYVAIHRGDMPPGWKPETPL